ncbi:STAS domain-containing protein [Streptomyces sp. NPDC087866]|uniref:STAS domain-containing protein n=1 Tax=Streptomyces sp. NPDC087866 TaxID=3365815 RepID=UPI0037F801D0
MRREKGPAVLASYTARHPSERAELSAEQVVHTGRWTLWARGAFDADTTSVLSQLLEEACQAEAPRVVINCSDITFADVAFLRALLCHSPGARLVVAAPSLSVCRLLEATETTCLLLVKDGPLGRDLLRRISA